MPIEFGTPGPPRRPVIPTRPSGGIPRAGPGVGGLARRNPAPRLLGPGRDRDAVYLLDCGVGLAFGHVHSLPLLHEHYGTQLRYVEDILLEWRAQSASDPWPPPPGSSKDLFDAYQRARLVKKAAIGLVTDVPALFGDAVDLGADAQVEVEELVNELRNLAPPLPQGGPRDRGECATVWYGKQLGPATQVVIICANDDRARRLASNHTIAHRNTATVLREMVLESRLTDAAAWELYERSTAVTELPAWCRPVGPDDFR